MNDATRFPSGELHTFVRQALIKAGVREWEAEVTARGLWHASMRGVDSHGIRLLPHYIQGVRHGRINPAPDMTFTKTMASTGILDADDGLGHAAGMRAIGHAMELADETGMGMVSVKRSSHCGAMAYFALEACQRDMIGMAFTHATARVMTPGGKRPFFGNNPICFAAPMQDEEPFCYDGATTKTTFNEVKSYGEQGRPLPPGLVADKDGEFTLDPAEADQLAPIGDYKGFGLSMVVDILCAMLSGMPAGPDVSAMYGSTPSDPRDLGQCFAAINIKAFQDPDHFKSRLHDIATRLRAMPGKEEGTHPMTPGDPQKSFFKRRTVQGIPLAGAVVAEFHRLEGELGITLPEPMTPGEED